MKKIYLLATAAFALATNSIAQPSRAKLDSLMDHYSAEDNFNGAALIAYKGEVLLNKGYGYRDVEKKIKHDANSIFQIGSNTKQFTSEIILQLAEKKKLSLQDKLTKYFPGYPSGDKITIEHLLTHTSGIYNYTEDSGIITTTHHVGMDEMVAKFKDHALAFEPGTRFDYSNSNYMLLGYIIEKVTGKKYEAIVRQQLLQPAGMAHSGFDFTGLKDVNKSIGYNGIEGTDTDPAPITDSSISFAAGALYSTVGDIYSWHRALQSYRLLPKTWQEKAYMPHRDKYAYGWMVDSMEGRRLILHTGGIPGFTSYEMRVEEDDVCIVLLSNNMGSLADNNEIAVNIIKCLYEPGYNLPELVKKVDVSRNVLKQYEGDYAITPQFIINISLKADGLYAQATGQQAFKIDATGNTTFYTKVVGAEIDFIQESGKWNKLILKQHGQQIPAMRQ